MRYLLFSIIFLFMTNIAYAMDSPEDIINNFYQARKFQKKILILTLAENGLKKGFTRRAKKITGNILYDYTIIEMKTLKNKTSYAQVEVKSRTLDKGIVTSNEFWKLSKTDGIWKITNIYTPSTQQLRNAVKKGSSLEQKVEDLANYKYEYKVEKIPPGTPLEKAIAYVKLRKYNKALYWLNLDVNRKRSAKAYFMRGIFHVSFGNKKQGIADLKIAIKKDPRYRILLQRLASGRYRRSRGSSKPTWTPGEKTRTGGTYRIFK